MKEQINKRCFYIAVVGCFITILIFEILTPMMSDDLMYRKIVQGAGSFLDLFRQEYDHYMNHIGRSVGHIVMRFLMYPQSLVPGKIVLAAVFTLMTWLMYRLAAGGPQDTAGLGGTVADTNKVPAKEAGWGLRKNPGDVRLYVLGVLLVWIFGVSFSDTVLWLTGACNYMVTTTIILADMLLYEWICGAGDKGDGSECHLQPKVTFRTVPFVTSIILGLAAGWCNENTSGGLILYVLYLIWKVRFREHRTLPLPLITGLSANIVGFIIMLLSPGNAMRLAAEETNQNIIVQMAARFFTVTQTVYELFFPLLIAAVIIAVLLYYRGVSFRQAERFYLFLFLFAATSYALMLAPQAQDRAFFGAGIFLFIALMQGVELIDVMEADESAGTGTMTHLSEDERVIVPVPHDSSAMIKTLIVSIMLLFMFFTYVTSAAKLIWIYRESKERMDYLAAQQAAGAEESGAPLLRPQFETKYSSAHRMDLDGKFTYWVNGMYAEYYDLNLIWGVEREEWTEY